MAADKSKGRKWDGKSRVSNDLYRKNYNKIFQKKLDFYEETQKEKQELEASYQESVRQTKERKEKEREELLKEIEERNGF
jgi:Skp family chaperone for outer membrane proteins